MPPDHRYLTFVEFCKEVDILIHDAQDTEKDMPQKQGWGHSLVTQACELAGAAQVRHLVLYHHDPDRTDAQLYSIEKEAQIWFQRKNYPIRCTVAFEGLSLEI